MTRHQLIRKLAKIVWTSPSQRYLSYIRSPQWQQRRREHMAIHPQCQICYWRTAIQVHHWSYRNLGNEQACELCSVCVDCHHRIHLLPQAANDNKQLELPLVS